MPKPKIDRQPRKILLFATRHFSMILINVLVMGATVAFVFGMYAYYKTPLDVTMSSADISQTTILYDRTGQHALYEIHGEENRKVISHQEIPDSMRLATIAAEDNDFYKHHGIKITSILRALKADVASSEMQQGGSTITQQLARNIFLTREKTIRRKVLEVILAIKLEQDFSKDEILDMYLNAVPYGSNAYGIQSASQVFFKKDAAELTLDESAFLATLPNATTYYSPYGKNTDELIAKQKRILDKISQLKLSDKSSVEEAKNIDTLAKVIPLRQMIDCPHFVFYVKDFLEQKYGKELVEKGGLRVYTSLDYNLQKSAENIVSTGIKTTGRRYGATNAALVAIDPKTGEILTMVGSVDYFDEANDGQVNVAIRPRQPGSSFKPFAYAKAFEKGYQPETLLYDVPTNFGSDGSGRDYMPHNYDGRFHGLVSMRQALAMSLNIPAVKTLYLAGVNDTINLAHRLGITTLNEKNRYGLALVLGGGEVTLLDETSGFSAFANEGKRNPANPILKITDSQGKILYENQPENKRVLDEQVARKINSVLSDNQARTPVFGSHNKLIIPGRTVAAKTGTTQEFHDAWTVGYTPSLATGVWVGNNDNDAMAAGADGSYVAAPLWNEFMAQALKNYPNETFIAYENEGELKNVKNAIKMIYYNKNSGKILSESKLKKTDPEKVGVRLEYSDNYSSAGNPPPNVELQGVGDPMIERWRKSLEDSFNYQDFAGSQDKEEND